MKKTLILSTMLFSTTLWADYKCDYSLNLSNAAIMLTDVQQVVQQEMQISRGQRSANGVCTQYFIFFGKGQANNYQRKAFTQTRKSINYNLHRLINLSGTLKDFNDALNNNEYVSGTAETKLTPYTNRLFISLPGVDSQNSPISGTYTDNVQARLYSYDSIRSRYTLEQSLNFAISIYVNRKIQISLIDEGGTFDPNSTVKVLDFGNLAQGQELGADLRIVSNTPYRVALSSQNNSRIVHAKGDAVTYSLKSNGGTLSLASSASRPVTLGEGCETTTSGDRYNLRIKILDSIENKSSGLYQDVITITATAN